MQLGSMLMAAGGDVKRRTIWTVTKSADDDDLRLAQRVKDLCFGTLPRANS
jgi:hypothetical protein